MVNRKAKVSLELLYHFQCAHCSRWWSVGDFKYHPGDVVFCPHCARANILPDELLRAEVQLNP